MLDEGSEPASQANQAAHHDNNVSSAAPASAVNRNASEKTPTLAKDDANEGSEKSEAQSNGHHKTARPTLEELSIGKLEQARRKKVNLLRMAVSQNRTTLFAVLNIGYLPLHQPISLVQAESTQAILSADPALTPLAEWLIGEFQEKIAWSIFRHQTVQMRTPLRQRIRSLLIRRYMPGTQEIADRYFRKNIPEYTLVQVGDLRQAAFLGMIEKIDDYDPAVGCTFMQYANAKHHGRIQGAIKDCLRKHWYSTRTIAKHRRIVNPMIAKLAQKLGRRITKEDFFDHYGQEWREVLEDAMFDSRVYNQGRTVSSDDHELVDQMTQVECDEPPCENRWNNEDSLYFRKRIMELLPDEQQAFYIYAYYWLGWNNEHIAKEPIMNCSTSKASEIGEAAQKRIWAFGGYALYQELMELLPE